MMTFDPTTTPAMEPWESHTIIPPAQQLHHHRVLTRLLFDPALEHREREVATAKAVTVIAQQARRDRLLLAEALKEQYKQQLAEEVAIMNKMVEETQAWVRREIENLRPVALAVVVEEYERAMERVQQPQGGRGGGGGAGRRRGGRFRLEEEEEEDENEDEGGIYVDDGDEEAQLTLLGGGGGERGTEGGLSPPSSLLTKKRASPMTGSGREQPQRSKKTRKQQEQQQQQWMGRDGRSVEEELVAMMIGREGEDGGRGGGGGGGGGGRGRGGGGEGFDPDQMAQEVMGSLNQALLQKQLTAALVATTREYERERQQALNEEMEKRVKQAMGQIEREMKSDYECVLEEEKEKVRILTEVEADQARKEMEEKLREEHKEEIQALMQQVGLA